MTRYIVNVSGGLSSYEALRRTLATHGHANVEAVFADVKGRSDNPHDGEDEDCYRFLSDIEQYLAMPIVRLNEGHTVWETLRNQRAISMLVNGNRVSPCSKVLKRQMLDRYVEMQYSPDECVQVLGFKWDERRRMDAIRRFRAPYRVEFPLADPPYVDDCHIAAQLEGAGIKPPRMYEVGFPHANCGGFCINAGQAQFARLYRWNPERYAYHEAQEARFRAEVRDDVSLLRDRRGGQSRAMTLTEFRERLERGERIEEHEWGGCACFATGYMQAALPLEEGA